MDIIQEIAKQIASYQEELANLPPIENKRKVTREQFTLLLSGIATCRKAPGIPVHMGYETLYHCSDEADSKDLRDHLQKIYGITDKDSLVEFCRYEYASYSQYEQFMTFWEGVPMFDVSELQEGAKQGFEDCKSVSAQFYPMLKERGYYSWDISETIGLYRKANACGILTDDEFWELSDPLVRLAQVFYHSYEEYAISCLCGAVYFMHKYDDNVEGFFSINYNLAQHLFKEYGSWRVFEWYEPEEPEWADVINNNPGCMITKAALDSKNIGYMYREEPLADYPDSGFRFFVGDESEEYISHTENTLICGFNTICNIDPTILAYFYCPVNRRFGKTEEGWVEEF